MDFPIDLPRWQVSFECYSLDPGRQYYLKVAAKNAVGITDYSDFGECSTDIDIPDTPNPPTAIAATWGSLTLALVMPYANGSDCTLFYVQYRIVQAFSKGQWSNPIQYNIKDVKSRIPYEAPASRDEDEAKKAQPAVRKREIKIQTGKLEQVTLQRNTQIQFVSVLIVVAIRIMHCRNLQVTLFTLRSRISRHIRCTSFEYAFKMLQDVGSIARLLKGKILHFFCSYYIALEPKPEKL